METKNQNLQDTSDRELVFKRTLNASRDLVWEVWTDPEHIAKWWGPTGFKNTIHKMDVKPGGIWDFIMHGPDGMDFPNRIEYIEVVKPERLVYFHSSDQKDDPGQFHVTVTFEDLGNKTMLTMRSIFKSKADKDYVVEKFGAIEGANQTLDRLEAHIAGL